MRNLICPECSTPFETKNSRKKFCTTNCCKIVNNRETSKTIRNRNLIRSYGITELQYNQMFADQLGCCKICSKHQINFKFRLAVDHCHRTKKIRGLLCHQCNQAIGLFYESKENMKKAIEYLEESE